nr:MAG TPA: hypothetical protein [Caudoviricetes sp.]DAN80079.1 MAG TPA: hypothetical protein [Caudoviricetes sp.]DAX37695.1 MAG TPA: hypothetical protein [Caudoviricetes sp.]
MEPIGYRTNIYRYKFSSSTLEVPLTLPVV